MSDEDVTTDDCFDDGQQHCPDKQLGLQFKHRAALLKFGSIKRCCKWKGIAGVDNIMNIFGLLQYCPLCLAIGGVQL